VLLVVGAATIADMLQRLSTEMLELILSFLTPVQSFAVLRSSVLLRSTVQAAAAAGRLLRRRLVDSADDVLEQYLLRGKRTGDRISLFVRDQTNAAYVAVVAVRQQDLSLPNMARRARRR
jgi:hypothetical protein